MNKEEVEEFLKNNAEWKVNLKENEFETKLKKGYTTCSTKNFKNFEVFYHHFQQKDPE